MKDNCIAHVWIDADGGELCCDLDRGHEDDLHYDEVDDISWKHGRP